jgi:hypothetical protein
MAASAYYADKISPNQARTPEGFLILLGQTICRSGWQPYRANEIDRGSGDYSTVQVYRSPSEVLAPAHIASLQGKPVTMRHPARFVDSTTASYAGMGHIENVRVGPRDKDGNVTLIADIHIHDVALIEQILSKQLRSISLGYRYDLADGPKDGTYQQRNLTGNHCAIVEAGRAGQSVYITDALEDNDMDGKKIDRLCELLEKLIAQRTDSEDADVIEEVNDDDPGLIERAVMTGNKAQRQGKPLGRGLVPITTGGAEGNFNPTAARDALAYLRRVHPAIEASGDRRAIDAFNNSVKMLKSQARGESFAPAFATDSHSKRRDDAAGFERSASRFHRKPLKVGHVDTEELEHSAADGEQPELSFEDAVKRARDEAQAKFMPKRR